MEEFERTWELAGTEELLGDSLFFSGEPGSVVHYREAQRALMPPGIVFSSRDENDRRMEAFERVTTKLYSVGGDGRARSADGCTAHPHYVPEVRRPESPPEPAKEVEVPLVSNVSEARVKSKPGRLPSNGDWWADYRLEPCGSMPRRFWRSNIPWNRVPPATGA